MDISHAAEDGDQENEAEGTPPPPVCHHTDAGRDPPAVPAAFHPDGVDVTVDGL